MEDKKVKFIPFHAINEFMLDQFRDNVIREVFSGFDQLHSNQRGAINNLVKKSVTIPGFRNSGQAPAMMKARHSQMAFERNADFCSQILAAWAFLKPDLANQVHELLKERSWEILPVEADRTKLPGFLTSWPESENYDTIGEAFKLRNPETQVGDDDLRLMAVWISGRLPMDNESAEAENQD